MDFKSIIVYLSSLICAISLFITVSITYFTYDTNTSVTKQTSGDIEAISFCGKLVFEYLDFHGYIELIRNIKLSDIVEFDGVDARKVKHLKYYIKRRVCFRLLKKEQSQTMKAIVQRHIELRYR